jgi:hypothetical protein
MQSVTLRAHYDEHIVLDEPFEIPTNAPLAVTVLTQAPPSSAASGRSGWLPALKVSRGLMASALAKERFVVPTRVIITGTSHPRPRIEVTYAISGIIVAPFLSDLA